MSTTPLNLDSLNDAFTGLDGLAGTPLLLDVDTVHEDPDQPRRDFDPNAQDELTASIVQSGIKSPLSVRAHPSKTGHYMLNFGARRLRSARAAGLTKVPAFVDELHTDYDQVVENLQRDNLTPMEMALFIANKIKGGAKPGEIARKLGLPHTAISKHMALVNAPLTIEAVYTSGRSTSPDTLYELRGVYDAWPVETDAFIASDATITRATVAALKKQLSTQAPENTILQDIGSAPEPHPRTSRRKGMPKTRPLTSGGLVLISGGRTGVLLDQMPNDMTNVVICWHDTGEVEEVPMTSLFLHSWIRP